MDRFETLCDRVGADRAETIRMGLELLEFFVDLMDIGKKIFIGDSIVSAEEKTILYKNTKDNQLELFKPQDKQ